MEELTETDNTSSAPNKKIGRAVSRSSFGKNKFVVSLLSLSLVLIVGTLGLALGQVQREQNLASDASIGDFDFQAMQQRRCVNITDRNKCTGDCEWKLEYEMKKCGELGEADCLSYRNQGCTPEYTLPPCRSYSIEVCRTLSGRCRVQTVGERDNYGNLIGGGAESCVETGQPDKSSVFMGCTGEGEVTRFVGGKCTNKPYVPQTQPVPQPGQPSQPNQPPQTAPSTTPPGGGSGSGSGGNKPVEPVVGYIRVSGQIKNCAGAPVPNVTVTMFSGDTTSQLTAVRTDSNGKYTLVKNYKESMGNSWFSVMAGRDANKNSSEGYYGRVATPKFTDVSGRSRNCSDINCNYKGNKASGGPYRESYVPGYGWSASNFKATFVSPNSSKTFVGMDFEQAGCPVATPTPTPQPNTDTIPQADLIMKYGSSLSIDHMLSDKDWRTIRINAKGKGKYDIAAYRFTTSFRGDAVASQAVQPLTCSSTTGKWVEIARQNNVELSPSISPIYLHWKLADLDSLKEAGDFGRKHLIVVNVVSKDASKLGVNNSVCTGNPAINTSGKACYSNNWCNTNGNRESDGMFKLVKLYE